MTTKGHYLPLKGKHDLSVIGDTSNSRYGNLNLNQKRQNSTVELIHSNSFSNEIKKVQNYASPQFQNVTPDAQKSKSSLSWKKSENRFPSEFSNIHSISDNKSESKDNGKNLSSKNKNSSTLSLHIAAYENSVEAAASDSFERIIKDTSNFDKSLLSVKQMTLSTVTSNTFEFSRQQTDDKTDPAIMQFKASQKLLNPNQGNGDSVTTNRATDSSVSSANPRDERVQQRMPFMDTPVFLATKSTERSMSPQGSDDASGDSKTQPPKFYQYFNPTSGQMEWKVGSQDASIEDDEDMIIQIARSNFGDMIYDYDRNDRYSAGLKYHIEKLKSEGKHVHVADIGTGTGLLSLMAVRHGADKVTAVEVFDPMAITAEKVIKKNGCDDKIKVIHLRSTEIQENLVEDKADIIVAEVFDTELIGEGALRSFKEGLVTLGKKGCRVVPAKGRIWICPIASAALQQFRKLPDKRFKAPFDDCAGTAAVFDIQFGEIDSSWFKALAEPFVAFDFNFEDADSIKYNEAFSHKFTVNFKETAIFDTVLMWWDIDMDGQGNNYISTIPPQFSSETAWRDHWMQAIYYLPEPAEVSPNQELVLHCSHDEYSLWFNVGETPEGPEFCSCQLHCAFSRYDFFRLHCLDDNESFVRKIHKACAGKTVLTFGDGSMISLYAAQIASKVYAFEGGDASARMIEGYAKENDLKNIKIIQSVKEFANEFSGQEITVIAEPFFSTAILPWHAFLRYSALIEEVKKEVGSNVKMEIMPTESKLYCLPVKFEHLWKIAAPVGTVDGFDLSDFDVLCQKARKIADPIVEQHSLFEYPSISTGCMNEVFTLSVQSKLEATTTVIHPENSETNALVFWTQTEFGNPSEENGRDSCVVSNGLLSSCGPGDKPQWNIGHRQGVYFLPFEMVGKSKSIEVFIEQKENDLEFKFNVC